MLGKRKMAKHFRISIDPNRLSVRRDDAAIAAEAALDGIYVLRTSLSAAQADAAATVQAYKRLARSGARRSAVPRWPPPNRPRPQATKPLANAPTRHMASLCRAQLPYPAGRPRYSHPQ